MADAGYCHLSARARRMVGGPAGRRIAPRSTESHGGIALGSHGVRSELKKISYPTKSETIGSTTVVLLFCVIMSIYLSIVDSFLVWLISRIV